MGLEGAVPRWGAAAAMASASLCALHCSLTTSFDDLTGGVAGLDASASDTGGRTDTGTPPSDDDPIGSDAAHARRRTLREVQRFVEAWYATAVLIRHRSRSVVNLGAVVVAFAVAAGCVGDAPTVTAGDAGAGDGASGGDGAAADAAEQADASPDAGGTDAPVVTDTGAPDTGTDAPTTFSVKNLPGLVLWLDAANGVSQSNGVVNQWADQSGAGNTAVPAAAHPTLVTSSINGNPAVHFEANQLVSIADQTSLQFGAGDFTLALVFKENMPSANAGILLQKFAGGTGPVITFNVPAGGKITAQIDATPLSSTSTSLNDGVARQYALQRTGTTFRFRVSGKDEGSLPNVTANISAIGQALFLGNASSGTQGVLADVAELVAIKGPTSAGDLASLEVYFKSKYALP